VTTDASVPEYLRPYTEAAEQHGAAPAAMLMASQAWQQQRFSVLASTVPITDRTVADIGSGRGDLLAWLYNNDIPYLRYLGVEAVAEFDAFARERAEDEDLPDAEFVLADFVADQQLFERLVAEHDVDVFLFSGSLNTLTEADALAVLDRAFEALADKPGAVLAFNFLAGGGDWLRPSTDLPRRDSSRWIAWALERTPLVTFCQSYLAAHDATIVMMRPLSNPKHEIG